MPHPYIPVTFGLGWTHHVLVSSVDEIDDQLMGWLKEAAEFSIPHQNGKR